MAAPSPSGTATIIAISEVAKVPSTSGSTPKLASPNSGVHFVPNRKSPTPTSPKKTMVSRSRA